LNAPRRALDVGDGSDRRQAPASADAGGPYTTAASSFLPLGLAARGRRRVLLSASVLNVAAKMKRACCWRAALKRDWFRGHPYLPSENALREGSIALLCGRGGGRPDAGFE
jgi:hypothetical protein